MIHHYFDPAHLLGEKEFNEKYMRSKLAVVRVFAVPRTINQIERTARVSFSDQLASLGR